MENYSILIILSEIDEAIEDYLMKQHSYNALAYDYRKRKLYVADSYRKGFLNGELIIQRETALHAPFLYEELCYNLAHKDYHSLAGDVSFILQPPGTETLDVLSNNFKKLYRRDFPVDTFHWLLDISKQKIINEYGTLAE